MFQRFLENLLVSLILLCCATSTTKTALGIIQLWFNYFAASFYKALDAHFPWTLRREMPQQLVHSLLSSFLFIGMISLPTFLVPLQNAMRLDMHTSQLSHPAFQVPIIHSPFPISFKLRFGNGIRELSDAQVCAMGAILL